MSINLLETIQNNLHYPPLKKIDPNTETVKEDNAPTGEHAFSQAAIPAVLTGLYSYSGKDENAERILRGDISSSWVSEFFGYNSMEAVHQVAQYSSRSYDDTLNEMNEIANEAVAIVRKELTPAATIMDVKKFLSNQTHNFLKYLPKDLHIGQVVDEESLDDNTNKMEGPISSLMHKIGSAFSNPSNEAEVNTKK
ncbi:MAG: hypothetical protein ABI685_15170 [Ferruginibacter sp.]